MRRYTLFHIAPRPVVLAAVTALLAFGSSSASAEPVRVFAIGHRIRMDDVITYQSYRDKMFAMMDAALPDRSLLVQAGVDDVASHIQPADPLAPARVLVNFSEDAGLAAAFIGTRGAAARSATAEPASVPFAAHHVQQAQELLPAAVLP